MSFGVHPLPTTLDDGNLLYRWKSFVASRSSPESLFIFRNFGAGPGLVMVWFLKHSVSVLFFDKLLYCSFSNAVTPRQGVRTLVACTEPTHLSSGRGKQSSLPFFH